MASQLDHTHQLEWGKVNAYVQQLTGKKPDLNAILFLIGLQELGQGPRTFSKEEKQDLMHIATCRVLSYSGHYILQGQDQQGWPHWETAVPLPPMALNAQEDYLKLHIITYMDRELGVI